MTYYHVGFAVPRLEDAMADLTAAAGAAWGDPRAGRIGEWDFRIVFTSGGPPFVELIESVPGSPWDASGGPRFHHLGYWSGDIAAGTVRLARQGYPPTFSGCPYGRPYAYHHLPGLGADIELVDVSTRAAFSAAWGAGAAHAAAVGERRPGPHEQEDLS